MNKAEHVPPIAFAVLFAGVAGGLAIGRFLDPPVWALALSAIAYISLLLAAVRWEFRLRTRTAQVVPVEYDDRPRR